MTNRKSKSYMVGTVVLILGLGPASLADVCNLTVSQGTSQHWNSLGTYSFATLNAAHDSSFVEGGTGSITVIPEPIALGLIALSSTGLIFVRRIFSL